MQVQWYNACGLGRISQESHFNVLRAMHKAYVVMKGFVMETKK